MMMIVVTDFWRHIIVFFFNSLMKETSDIATDGK